MFTFGSVRALLSMTLLALFILAGSTSAHARSQTISAADMKKTDGAIVLDLRKTALWRIKMKGVDTSRILLKSGKKQITLNKWIKELKLKPRAEMLIALDPANLPVTAADAKEISSLTSTETWFGNIYIETGDGAPGDIECWCTDNGYGCWII